MSEVRDLLEQGLCEAEILVTPEQIEQLAALARLLGTWAARINLTGHREPAAIVRRLILDAAAVSQLLPEYACLADLGSGAGFPGLPLAILRPGSRVVLVEARLRRHHFQRAAVRELGLGSRAALLRGRIEELEPIAADVALAQAVAPSSQVLGWMLPWVRPGGLLVIPGGAVPPDPLGGSGLGDSLLDVSVCSYELPLGGPARTLWMAHKLS